MIYVGKGPNKKFAPLKKLPPDSKSLLQKIKRANLVSYSYFNCLTNHYIPLNPEEYGWQKENDMLTPVPFIGESLPSTELYEQMAGIANTFTNDCNPQGDSFDSE